VEPDRQKINCTNSDEPQKSGQTFVSRIERSPLFSLSLSPSISPSLSLQGRLVNRILSLPPPLLVNQPSSSSLRQYLAFPLSLSLAPRPYSQSNSLLSLSGSLSLSLSLRLENQSVSLPPSLSFSLRLRHTPRSSPSSALSLTLRPNPHLLASLSDHNKGRLTASALRAHPRLSPTLSLSPPPPAAF
jgi:hypothetical protein